jgi:hypothetical protein
VPNTRASKQEHLQIRRIVYEPIRRIDLTLPLSLPNIFLLLQHHAVAQTCLLLQIVADLLASGSPVVDISSFGRSETKSHPTGRA